MTGISEKNPSAFELGESAARMGYPVLSNPYRLSNEELAQQWYSGYASYQRRTAYHKGK